MNRPVGLPPRIHIVGRRNSGKTTLVCDLVRELTTRGLRVATIKHTHHNHELDTPGKDSWNHREAGAVGVGILSPHMMAAFVPSERSEHTTADYDQFNTMFPDCDLLIVEGDLHADGVKLEVWRADVSEKPYAIERQDIRAVISDDSVEAEPEIWSRSSLSTLATRVLEVAGVRG